MAAKVAALVVMIMSMLMMTMSFSRGATGTLQISCDTVYNDLYPCLSYIMNGGKVDPSCCTGIKTVIGLAKTKNDRQGVCSCLKSLVSSATDGQIKNAANIPKACGVNIPFKITRNIDCSKVNLA